MTLKKKKEKNDLRFEFTQDPFKRGWIHVLLGLFYKLVERIKKEFTQEFSPSTYKTILINWEGEVTDVPVSNARISTMVSPSCLLRKFKKHLQRRSFLCWFLPSFERVIGTSETKKDALIFFTKQFKWSWRLCSCTDSQAVFYVKRWFVLNFHLMHSEPGVSTQSNWMSLPPLNDIFQYLNEAENTRQPTRFRAAYQLCNSLQKL